MLLRTERRRSRYVIFSVNQRLSVMEIVVMR